MPIIARMLPNDPPMTWEEFCQVTPPYSIALDGYVADAPQYQDEGPRANFNHHEGVDRLATRATCAQIMVAIRSGLFDRFRDADGPKAEVYMNDCDQDVCLSWFQLKHSYIAKQVINPPLNRLVGIEDILDATAGTSPYPPELPVLQEIAWVFEPYTRFRLSGNIDRRDPDEFMGVLTDVEHRIMQYVGGRGKTIPLDTRYRVIAHHAGWSMVIEEGAQARAKMFSDGIRAFVSVRERGNGRFSYTVGRMSRFIPFNVGRILAECSATEPEAPWGGGTTAWAIIGGSSRSLGSRLEPNAVTEIVKRVQAEASPIVIA